ncbi:MAG: transposase [Casimicrobiaceae bacterium]|nr:transposase [Casimicrobiaceae bacterium]
MHSTDPLARQSTEIKLRTIMAGVFPNECTVVQLMGVTLRKQNDGRMRERRHTWLEGAADARRFCPGSAACPIAKRIACVSVLPSGGPISQLGRDRVAAKRR